MFDHEALERIEASLKRLETKMSALDDAITALTAAVQAAVTEMASIPGQITAAVNAAIAAGATPAQLQALSQLSSDLQGRVNDLNSAVAAAPKPAA